MKMRMKRNKKGAKDITKASGRVNTQQNKQEKKSSNNLMVLIFKLSTLCTFLCIAPSLRCFRSSLPSWLRCVFRFSSRLVC